MGGMASMLEKLPGGMAVPGNMQGQVGDKAVTGMIAIISGQVAASCLNIATMRVSRCAAGGEAMVTLELDGKADPALIDRLAMLKDVYHVAYLAARVEEELCDANRKE